MVRTGPDKPSTAGSKICGALVWSYVPVAERSGCQAVYARSTPTRAMAACARDATTSGPCLAASCSAWRSGMGLRCCAAAAVANTRTSAPAVRSNIADGDMFASVDDPAARSVAPAAGGRWPEQTCCIANAAASVRAVAARLAHPHLLSAGLGAGGGCGMARGLLGLLAVALLVGCGDGQGRNCPGGNCNALASKCQRDSDCGG